MKRTFLVVLATYAIFLGNVQGQTITPNESLTIVASPKKIGINIDAPATYGAGELYKNLLWRNPGFEPDLYRQKFAAPANGTTTTFTPPYYADPVVANFWSGANFWLYRGTPKAQVCNGTIASNTASVAPSTAPKYTFSSACSSAVQAGDILVLRKAISCTPEADWEDRTDSSGHAGWHPDTYSLTTGGLLQSDCTTPYDGTQSLILNGSASGSYAGIVQYIDSGQYTLGILIDGTYTVTGYYRTVSGSPTLSVAASRYTGGSVGNPLSCTTQMFPSVSAWTKFTASCTGNETNALPIATISAELSASGGSIEIDDVAFQKSSTDPTNTTVFRDEVVNTLKAHCAGASLSAVPCELRDWSGTYAGQNADEIANTVNPLFKRRPVLSGLNYDYAGGNTNSQMAVSLEEFLELCKLVSAEPYYVFPETTNLEDASNWIDYMSGSTSTVYGAKRAANGQTATWLSVFPIHLSMGNENWNSPAEAAQGLPYRAAAPDLYYDYSTDAAGVWNAMRASTSFPTSGNTYDLVLGFQDDATGGGTGIEAAMTRASATSGELAPYTQRYLGNVTPLTALWNPLFYEVVANTTNSSAYFYQNGSVIKDYGKLNVYEFDNSTQYDNSGDGAVTQSVLDSFTDAAGYGTATALQALQHLTYGVVDQNFFGLTGYISGGPNGTVVHNFGAVIDMGGLTNHIRPQELGMQLVNAAIIGTMYSCPVTSPNTYNLGANLNGQSPSGTPAESNVSLEYAYCFKSGTNRSLVAINTDVTNSHSVSFGGSQAPQGNVTITRYAPASISAINEATGTNVNVPGAPNVVIGTPANSVNPTGDTLPPYSVNTYSWSTLLYTSLTESGSPNPATVGQTVTFTATVTGTGATGTVTFYLNGASLGTSPLSGGVATLNVSTNGVTPGVYTNTASYSGDSTHAASNNNATPYSLTVNQASTTTGLTASPNPVTRPATVTFTATVARTAGSGTPTGSVGFYDGSTLLDTATLSSGVASYVAPTSGLSAGTYPIHAVYSGDTYDTGSTSSVVNVVVY